MADDHAAHAIGAYGSAINETPDIDRLATEGMRFDACFCTNSICSPSRATILTGTYNHVNGVTTLDTPMDARQPTSRRAARRRLPDRPGRQVAPRTRRDPRSAGVRHWTVLPDQGAYHDPLFLEPGGRAVVRAGYATDLITDLALDWLDRRDPDRPLPAWCTTRRRTAMGARRHATWPVRRRRPPGAADASTTTTSASASRGGRGAHADVRPRRDRPQGPVPPGLTAGRGAGWRYQRYIKDYLRCVRRVDDNVGRLLDSLDDAGLADDTVVVYTSDQGFFLGDHGWFDKRFMYEESLRMPLLVRYPREVAAGTSSAAIVLNVDFAQTFLDLAGVDADATDAGPLAAPAAAWRGARRLADEHVLPLLDARRRPHRVWAHRGVRTERHKLVHYYERGARPARRVGTSRIPRSGSCSTSRPTRSSCAASTTTRPTPACSPTSAPSWIASPTRSATSRPMLIHGLARRGRA